MRRLILVLLSVFMTSMAAHAITVIDVTEDPALFYDFGNLPIGETREVALLLPNDSAGLDQLPLSMCRTSLVIVRCEGVFYDSWYLDPAPQNDIGAYKVINADCGPKPGHCIALQVTSRTEDLLSSSHYCLYCILYRTDLAIFGYDANSRSYFFGRETGDQFEVSGVRYQPIPVPSPVPVPAALPLLATGVAALGVIRKRRKAGVVPTKI